MRYLKAAVRLTNDWYGWMAAWASPFAVRPTSPSVRQVGYARRWSLEDLAKPTETNASHLIHLFKKDVGEAPMGYLWSRRMVRQSASFGLPTDGG